MNYRTCLLAFALVGLGSCTKIKEPQFRRLESFGVKNFGLQKVDVGFKVTYFNPNGFGVNVKEAVADVYVDSIYLGKFNQDQEVSVDKNAEFSIPLTGSLSLAEMLKLKTSDLSNREYSVRANGSVRVGKAGVFISKPFTYSGKHKVDLKL
jgi:LEA14-like dessication related protein